MLQGKDWRDLSVNRHQIESTKTKTIQTCRVLLSSLALQKIIPISMERGKLIQTLI